MTENEAKAPEVSKQDNLQEELQEQYLKSLEELEEGSLVDGIVVEVTSEHVFLDVGYKSEGKISTEEFDELPTIGDTIAVVLIKKENRAGELIVSKKKADQKIIWKNIKDAFNDKAPVSGKLVKSIKGGFEVDLGGEVKAFNPISKADIQKVDDPESLINVESKFYIERLYSDNRVNIIVSRRKWLEERNVELKTSFFENTQPGDEVEGTVKSFTSFGAFIDLGGFDGLLHINDMSWGHVTKPKDYVKKGQVLKFKVIKLDPEEQKINLSLKHFKEDPWLSFETRYQVGDVVKGTVTKLADFGAFIEIEEGIEGLVHISELSWVKRISHPKEILKPGDVVDTKILGYNLDSGKVSLGLKQVLPNPWDDIEKKYPVGKQFTRPVKKITNSGAFIELEEGIDGFLHVDDLSWTKKIRNVSSVLEEGKDIDFVVISIEPENRNIRLGIKQLEEDPWAMLKNGYAPGSLIEGEVTSKTDFGIFVRVQGEIEGLIPKTQLADPNIESIDAKFDSIEVGSTIKAAVLDINPGKQKLSLSIREMHKKQQREELEKYIHTEDDGDTYTLGDYLNRD